MDKFDSSLVLNLFDTGNLLTNRDWQPLAEGVSKSDIYVAQEHGLQAALLHYLPGAKVDKHLHTGYEHILILQGSQCDGEQTYLPGMLVIHKPGTEHSIVSSEGCMALGLWEKPVQFK